MSATTREEVRTAVDLPGAVILDVRTKEEVAAAPLTKKPYKHASCHLDDPSELLEKAEELMPDKNGEPWIESNHSLFSFIDSPDPCFNLDMD